MKKEVAGISTPSILKKGTNSPKGTTVFEKDTQEKKPRSILKVNSKYSDKKSKSKGVNTNQEDREAEKRLGIKQPF